MSETIYSLASLPTSLTITRNNVDWGFNLAKKERGDNAGDPYMAPEAVTESTLEDYIAWAGMDYVLQQLNAKERIVAQNVFDQAVMEDEEHINWDKLTTFHTERSVRGETIPELEALRDAANAEAGKIMLAMNAEPHRAMELLPEGLKFNKLAGDYQAAIESKKRERKPRAKKNTGTVAPKSETSSEPVPAVDPA